MKLAFEMLDKKSSMFSDRPILQFAGVMYVTFIEFGTLLFLLSNAYML